jgi:hypothetical protein
MPLKNLDKQDEVARRIGETLKKYLNNLADELGKILAETVDKDSEAGKNLAIAFPDRDKSEVPADLAVEVSHHTMTFTQKNLPAAYEIYTEASVCAGGSDQELFPFKLKIELIPFKDELDELSKKIIAIRDLFDQAKRASDNASRKPRENLEPELSWCEDLFTKIRNAREMSQGDDEKNDELKQVLFLLEERLDILKDRLTGEPDD